MLCKILKVLNCLNLHMAKNKVQEEESVYLQKWQQSFVSEKQCVLEFVSSFSPAFTDVILI